ncbi:MAG TPA: SAM-dependent methyltransferase [Acidobacteria bacterium]|nr:SAM-dependent methyltransferase [Acidobacteriota bacterium]
MPSLQSLRSLTTFSAMPSLLCPVRTCAAPLTLEGAAWRCPQGHSFDLARSGYANLLQPQDRKSKQPGDPKEAVLARRRYLEAGHGDFLRTALLAAFDGLALPPRPAVLDVGCGEGYFLGHLAQEREIEGTGIDLSAPAVDLAARRWHGLSWFVVNADRALPFASESFDLALSLTARRNPPELHRLLRPAGRLLVTVPGEDDLIELRTAVQGEGLRRDRVGAVLDELAPFFALEARRSLRQGARLDAAPLRDLLASTYRGARSKERGRVEALTVLEVSFHLELLILRKLPPPGGGGLPDPGPGGEVWPSGGVLRYSP